MNKEKIIMLLIESLIREFGVATLDELIILCMRKGIKISAQFISDAYYINDCGYNKCGGV